MIKLERHIEILLLSNDCVIVPDLGGFVAHQVCSHYDEEEGVFLPPLRTLGFNPQLKLNDSLLAQSYVEAYDISYPEAVRRITDEVRELRQHLDNEGCYELSNIGKLYVNEEGNLAFEPCEAGILTPGLYGLSTFDFSILPTDMPRPTASVAKRERPLPNEDHDKETTVNNALKNIVVDSDSVFSNNDDDDERTIKIKVSTIRNAIIAAAAVVLLFVIATPLSNFSGTGVTISNLSTDLFTSMIPKDTSTGNLKVDVPKDSSAKSTNLKTNNVKPAQASPTIKGDSSSRYCIILASRITRKNAERFVGELKDAGITDAYTYIHNNVVRVAYGYFSTEREAQDSLAKLRGKNYFEQAWVYEK